MKSFGIAQNDDNWGIWRQVGMDGWMEGSTLVESMVICEGNKNFTQTTRKVRHS